MNSKFLRCPRIHPGFHLRYILIFLMGKFVLWFWPILTVMEQKVWKIYLTQTDGISSNLPSPYPLYICLTLWCHPMTVASLSTRQNRKPLLHFHIISCLTPIATRAQVWMISILLLLWVPVCKIRCCIAGRWHLYERMNAAVIQVLNCCCKQDRHIQTRASCWSLLVLIRLFCVVEIVKLSPAVPSPFHSNSLNPRI